MLETTSSAGFKRSRAKCETFRALVYSVLSFCTFARSDTGVFLKFEDILFPDDGIHVTLRNFKGKKHLPGTLKPLLFPTDAVKGLHTLLQHFKSLRKLLEPAGVRSDSNLWEFPWETSTTWRASRGDAWLQHALQQAGCPQPPKGAVWTSHSMRKGATTSASAIGVVDTVYCYVADWSLGSKTRFDYIDPTARPSPAMMEFFGWLLPTRLCHPSPE